MQCNQLFYEKLHPIWAVKREDNLFPKKSETNQEYVLQIGSIKIIMIGSKNH